MPTSTLADRVRVFSDTVGTATTIGLGNAVAGYLGTEELIDGATYSYLIEQGADFEYGRGVYTASGATFTRNVIRSTLADMPIAIGSGTFLSFVLLVEDLNERIGIPGNFTIGTVTAVPHGTPPSVAIAGTAPNFTLSFALETGPDGIVPAITIGTVMTLPVGSPATASITGTSPNYVLDLGIPTGATGDIGATPTLAVGTVSSGLAPAVVLTGTALNPVLNFTLVPGATGLTGLTGATGTPGYISTDTWAHLAAITPSGGAGSVGFAAGPDTGTHTDANGATGVPNTGQFTYQASPAGWVRIAAALGPTDPASGARVISSLAQYGATAIQIAYSIDDTSGRSVFAITQAGKCLLDIDPAARAYTLIQSLATTAVTSVGVSNISGLNQRAGAITGGSPYTGRPFADVVVDTSRRVLFGVQDDGTFVIAKYDSRILSAVQYVESSAGTPVPPFPVAESGQIVSYTGSTRTVLTTEGTNSDPRRYASKIGFLSDRFRSLKAPYVMDYDGSNQRAMLSAPLYEIIIIIGQSNATGEAVAAVTTTAPYPTQLLMLTGGPVLRGASTISGAAGLLPCKETTFETIATSMGAAILDKELPFRPNLQLVMIGHGISGTAYAAMAKNTACYNDVLAQVSRVIALAAGASVVVRGIYCRHGEADIASSTYEADLVQWQSDYETDIKALTGQKETIPFFVSQIGSMRQSYTTVNAALAKSPLAELAASVDNVKFVITSSDSILPYLGDALHTTATSNRLKGEYDAKAVAKVIGEGRDWRAISPKAFASWAIGSTTIDIPFNVPVGALVLDTALCTDPGNFGFTYSDASGRTISSVALKAGTTDTIRITLSGTIGATAVLDYAFSNGTNGSSGPTAGARGCLRDSDPALSRWDGVTHLYNAAVSFKQALN